MIRHKFASEGHAAGGSVSMGLTIGQRSARGCATPNWLNLLVRQNWMIAHASKRDPVFQLGTPRIVKHRLHGCRTMGGGSLPEPFSNAAVPRNWFQDIPVCGPE